eukprot:CAMPEP_0185036370 /NCGR_PEP_ID=MMETSP1103-20130426/29272_1 /TAXON_ID=36769 /ORGANISM="Paraphysomonas bandaiensis, Strain Caron Lab Isolate" /LENGTH=546 /DNA_ID=CAMNT_0027573887 /DNA_START=167 /DNA_END=1807 /DNA_ORIENTATION=-
MATAISQGKRREVGTGNSTLYVGPVGIGKTSIMIVAHVITSLLLSDCVISLYCEYDDEDLLNAPTPFSLLQAEVPDYNGCSDIKQLLSWINNNADHPKAVVFFADEIHALYVKKSSNDNSVVTHAAHIVRELAKIGKSSFNIGVASGSSVNTEGYALRPQDYGFIGYRTLNNSVYNVHNISPIRDKGKCIELSKLIFQKPDLSEEVTQKLFLQSGGVGRRIIDKSSSEFIPRALPKTYYLDPALGEIIREMYLHVAGRLRRGAFDPWAHSHSLATHRVLEIIKVHHGDCNVQRRLSLYREESILFQCPYQADKVELLEPGMLYSVDATVGSDLTKFEMYALEGILTGWSDTRTLTEPSPGHCVERPLLQIIAEHRLFAQLVDECPCVYISQLRSFLEDDIVDLRGPNMNFTIRTGHKCFVGIDGFMFAPIEDNQFSLFLIQIKTGKLNMEISESEMKKYIEKAGAGIAKLMKMVTRTTEPLKIVVEEFLFLTTKRLTDDARTYVSNPMCLQFLQRSIPVTIIEQNRVLSCFSDKTLVDRLQKWLQH